MVTSHSIYFGVVFRSLPLEDERLPVAKSRTPGDPAAAVVVIIVHFIRLYGEIKRNKKIIRRVRTAH